MMPTLGATVLYRNPIDGKDIPAIITEVSPDGQTVCLTTFPPRQGPHHAKRVRQQEVGEPLLGGQWRPLPG